MDHCTQTGSNGWKSIFFILNTCSLILAICFMIFLYKFERNPNGDLSNMNHGAVLATIVVNLVMIGTSIFLMAPNPMYRIVSGFFGPSASSLQVLLLTLPRQKWWCRWPTAPTSTPSSSAVTESRCCSTTNR